jgi:exonuclease SbcC
MANSANSSAEDVRKYLEQALEDAVLANVRVDEVSPPILLLTTKQNTAAFAFANVDVRGSFDTLYGGFKKYYTTEHKRRDSKEISFVLCVPFAAKGLEDFQSKVETDVYFCRKFVIALLPDLSGALARLPFLPLAPLHGRPLRPPSAQTFLQQCGVKAELARWLAVQKEAGPETIINACIEGRFGEPKFTKPGQSFGRQVADKASLPVKLETVQIQNFRAYRDKSTFELGSNVTVLYGPNGFGKTSFFDAIDFGVTGGIGRIRVSSDVRFQKAVKHLDSGSELGLVSLAFRGADGVHTLTRTLADPKRALFDGENLDRKAVLDRLTSGDIPTTDRVENFVSLFRATHLFSQEQQELTKDFQTDCTLSASLVSRMLAFEDYANAIGKSDRICELLQSALRESSNEALALSTLIGTEKKDLEQLSGTSAARPIAEVLERDWASLRKQLAEVGITSQSDEFSIGTVRGWRGALEVRRLESESRAKSLSALASELAAVVGTRGELTSVESRIVQVEKDVNEIRVKVGGLESAQGDNDKAIVALRARRQGLESRAASFEWVHATKATYSGLVEARRSIEGALEAGNKELATLRDSENKAAADVQAQDKILADSTQSLKEKQGQLAGMKGLVEEFGKTEKARDRLNAVVDLQNKDGELQAKLSEQARSSAALHVAAVSEESALARAVAQLDRTEVEVKKAIALLQGHVTDGICPLCGVDHRSIEELLRRIREHTNVDLGSGARKDLAAAKEKVKTLADQVASIMDQQKATSARLTELGKEKHNLEQELSRYAAVAARFGVGTRGGKETANALSERHKALELEVGALTKQVSDKAAGLEAVGSRVAQVKTSIATQLNAMKQQTGRLQQLDSQISQLRNDPRRMDVPLDVADGELASLRQESDRKLKEVRSEIEMLEAKAGGLKREQGALQQGLEQENGQLLSLRGQLAALQNRLSLVAAQIGALAVPGSLESEQALALAKEEVGKAARLAALLEASRGVELALDAVTTGAALMRMTDELHKKEKNLDQATRFYEAREPWYRFFIELAKAVEGEQNRAIDAFTRDYGPRASVIQRRLRSVYGFDDIEIRSQESAISVRVKRNGEELHPTDYFSQSQQQTLLLSLFLTACSSQNWSSFSPVFLDDPITHFDDMNTYAFLDLIVGLLDSDFGERQFIISTCDAKLLQLAQQKFRFLGDRAKFHRFVAIGANGPVVERVSHQ